VKSNSHELDKQYAFNSFCKQVLKNEARDCYDAIKRLRTKEASFSELSARELEQLATQDKYFQSEQTFSVLGYEVVVTNENIAQALQNLPERNRDIILLYYFLDLSDGEIGKKLNLIRSTVQYQRSIALRELTKLLKGEIVDE